MAKARKETEAVGNEIENVSVSAPNFRYGEFTIRGISPLVQNKFSSKAQEIMKLRQEAGDKAKKDKAKEAKDFMACYEGTIHRSPEGWEGIPAPAFRNACISACRLVGFKMTIAKMSVFCEADGYDATDGTPLVRITKGKPHYCEHMVRIQTTTDVRARSMWDAGWEAVVRLRWDDNQFSTSDMANLMVRAGLQVGIGEGRPDSRTSAGMGWGLFEVVNK